MDSIEYAMRMGAKVEASLKSDPEMPWHERIAKASAAIEAEEKEDEK
jgi:hypothetical protein